MEEMKLNSPLPDDDSMRGLEANLQKSMNGIWILPILAVVISIPFILLLIPALFIEPLSFLLHPEFNLLIEIIVSVLWIFCVLLWARMHGLAQSLFQFEPIQSAQIRTALPWGLLSFALAGALWLLLFRDELFMILAPSDSPHPSHELEDSLLLATSHSNYFAPLAEISLLAIPLIFLGPYIEEIVFRGWMLPMLIVRGWKPWIAIGLTSCIFGLLHFDHWSSIFMASVSGVIFAYLRLKTGSLIIPIIAHAVHNACLIIIMLIATALI